MKKYFLNSKLLVFSTIVFSILVLSSIICAILFFCGIMQATTDTGSIAAGIIFTFFGVCSIGLYLIYLPTWGAYMKFSKNGLYLITPFKKRELISFKNYHYIYKAKYFQSTIFHVGYCINYIVFSKKYISNFYLEHINMINNSTETIKVRYSKKNYDFLISVLPDNLKQKLHSIY